MSAMPISSLADQPSNTVPDDEAWRAVEEHDTRYDGRFVYAVRTTRIYCRPSCSSKRPARKNVSFFAAPGAAERAGYRPCKRCDPRGEHQEPGAVARARAYLDANPSRSISLDDLAAAVGMSAHHLQRSFKQLVGVSPKEYQDALRTDQFRKRLRAGDSVSRATYEAGYGSSSRVYERAAKSLGMTPAVYRKGGVGMHIVYTIADSPLGRVLVGITKLGVCAVSMGDSDGELIAKLRADFPRAVIDRGDHRPHAWVTAVLERIRHPKTAKGEIPLDVNGTAFQRLVWKALQDIPAGDSRSYTEMAAAIGNPKAVRAVARACATNKVAVVIPCHRVVREDGSLGGYRWGMERKERLLAEESE